MNLIPDVRYMVLSPTVYYYTMKMCLKDHWFIDIEWNGKYGIDFIQ